MSKKPSILFINRALPPEHPVSGRLLLDLALGFGKDGWQVSVIAAGDPANVPSLLKKRSNVSVYRVGEMKSSSFLRALYCHIKMAIQAFRLPRHDIVVTLTDPPLLAVTGQILCQIKGSRHIHWCHDLYPEIIRAGGGKISKPMLRLLQRLNHMAMKRADRVVALGRCMARKLAHLGVPTAKISVIPNWSDPRVLVQQARKKKEGKDLFADEEPRFRIVYAGALGRVHPYADILEAAERLSKKFTDVEFIFAGDGQQYEELARKKAERGLTNIRMLPYQPEANLSTLMESGDLHIVTLAEAASGLSVPCKFYNGLAVRRPVIFVGPENSEVARVIEDFKCGTLVHTGDIEALIYAIETYRSNEAFWFAAQKGAEKAAKLMTPEQSIQLWIEKAQMVRESEPEF
ncbi:MAG: glycosyltransferase family 4 protein [Pseudobdellovibrionaceae bacterium]